MVRVHGLTCTGCERMALGRVCAHPCTQRCVLCSKLWHHIMQERHAWGCAAGAAQCWQGSGPAGLEQGVVLRQQRRTRRALR